MDSFGWSIFTHSTITGEVTLCPMTSNAPSITHKCIWDCLSRSGEISNAFHVTSPFTVIFEVFLAISSTFDISSIICNCFNSIINEFWQMHSLLGIFFSVSFLVYFNLADDPNQEHQVITNSNQLNDKRHQPPFQVVKVGRLPFLSLKHWNRICSNGGPQGSTLTQIG